MPDENLPEENQPVESAAEAEAPEHDTAVAAPTPLASPTRSARS
jgi:hypothetical protein